MTDGTRRTDFADSRVQETSRAPLMMGKRGLIAAGHYMATTAGHHILQAGGTAIDAGVAAGLALNVALFTHTSFGGVAPIILYHRETDSLVTLDGLGMWPELASSDYFREHHGGALPEGILRSVTPGAPDSWLTALEKFGTLTLGEVLEPAWELATGMPVSAGVAESLRSWEDRQELLNDAALDIFFPGGRALEPGQELIQEELAQVFRALMDEEAAARRQGLEREEALRRARDLVYKGWIAEKLSRYHEEHGGLMRESDLAQHEVELASPLHTNYLGYDVYTCGPWCQGPLLIQFLNMLETFDLGSMKHNSPDYLHLLLEVMNLAFADRENFYGDPRFTEVPLEGLTSREYARQRVGEVDLDCAEGQMPLPGNLWLYEPGAADRQVTPVDVERYLAPGENQKSDTSYVVAVDKRGNVFSATPSDPVFWTPIIPGLGFSCSGRGAQSRVDPAHPSSLEPGKRPRLTPNPALVMLDGRPLMGIGCPGGDVQTQGMLQVFLNMVHFGMNPQQAIEAPRLLSFNFPNSFAPHTYHPGRVDVESRIAGEVRSELADRGHSVNVAKAWEPLASSVHVGLINPVNGLLLGGADPRREGSAIGW